MLQKVVFDENDGMKTKRSTKFPTAVPPPMTANGGKRLPKQSVDDRSVYLKKVSYVVWIIITTVYTQWLIK